MKNIPTIILPKDGAKRILKSSNTLDISFFKLINAENNILAYIGIPYKFTDEWVLKKRLKELVKDTEYTHISLYEYKKTKENSLYDVETNELIYNDLSNKTYDDRKVLILRHIYMFKIVISKGVTHVPFIDATKPEYVTLDDDHNPKDLFTKPYDEYFGKSFTKDGYPILIEPTNKLILASNGIYDIVYKFLGNGLELEVHKPRFIFGNNALDKVYLNLIEGNMAKKFQKISEHFADSILRSSKKQSHLEQHKGTINFRGRVYNTPIIKIKSNCGVMAITIINQYYASNISGTHPRENILVYFDNKKDIELFNGLDGIYPLSIMSKADSGTILQALNNLLTSTSITVYNRNEENENIREVF
jgi:hypothetical protein